jgi:hypothetical protein
MAILDFGFWIWDLIFINPQSAIKNPKSAWRKGWDSNPRNPFEVHSISNAANSTALAPFRKTFYFQRKTDFKSEIRNHQSKIDVAERVGFEPTVPVKVQQFSRLPDSTALAPLRTSEFSILMV